MGRDLYVGIDLAIAKNKRLPVCVAENKLGRFDVLPLRKEIDPSLFPKGSGNRAFLSKSVRGQFVEATIRLFVEIEAKFSGRIRVIAIDAPRAPANNSDGRECERELNRRNWSCFSTPTASKFCQIIKSCDDYLAKGGSEQCLPYANLIWMLAGFDLFEALSVHWTTIEVFPNATLRALSGNLRKKNDSAGLDHNVAEFANAAEIDAKWIQLCLNDLRFGPRHDRFDALLSAWVASLPEVQRQPLGSGQEAIWLPKLHRN